MERVKLEFPAEAIIHRHPLAVRVTDMNYGRHLGHDALVSLLHEARIQAFAALGLSEWDMHGYPTLVADLAVQYQSEARWPDALIIATAVPEPQGKALTVYQRIYQAETEQIVATARVNQLLIDVASGRPIEVTEQIQQALVYARSG
ncbi:MAG: acyl-CoA thioesterase [Halomonas sp.]|uniref:acyl-CoA thioesterase n=1 Tax=unclassified Halomonas TaxID=2609666 RepID=UPI002653DB5E|nr:thioesterase family protein [Halomonas sp.]